MAEKPASLSDPLVIVPSFPSSHSIIRKDFPFHSYALAFVWNMLTLEIVP